MKVCKWANIDILLYHGCKKRLFTVDVSIEMKGDHVFTSSTLYVQTVNHDDTVGSRLWCGEQFERSRGVRRVNYICGLQKGFLCV